MANKFRQEKLNAKSRAIRSAINHPDKIRDYAPDHVTLKRYADRRMKPCEILMDDIQYFFWASTNNKFDAKHWAEAFELEKKVRYMLPPKPQPKKWKFSILIRDNELVDVRLVKATSTPKPGYLFTSHLDLSLVSYLGPNKKEPARMLLRKIIKWCFGGKKPSASEIREFFSKDKYFDLKCRSYYFPNVPRLDRPTKPREWQ